MLASEAVTILQQLIKTQGDMELKICDFYGNVNTPIEIDPSADGTCLLLKIADEVEDEVEDEYEEDEDYDYDDEEDE